MSPCGSNVNAFFLMHWCVRTLIEDYSLEFAEAAHLLNQTAYYLYRRAQYPQAEPLYQRALAIWEQQLGPHHPNTAAVRENYHALRRDMQHKGKVQH